MTRLRTPRTASALIVAITLLATVLTTGPAPTIAAATTPVNVLIMGDSFSAGNGAQDYSFNRCRRSPHTWGQLLAQSDALSVPGRTVDVLNRACTGAVARNVVPGADSAAGADDQHIGSRSTGFSASAGASDTALGQSAQAACDGLPNDAGDDYYVAGTRQYVDAGYWTVKCSHRVRPQIDSVNSDRDLVVMTLGGNDMGFADILAACIIYFPAFGKLDKEDCKKRLADGINYVNTKYHDDLLRVVQQINAKLNPPSRTGNRGRILLLSYPNLIANDDYTYGDNKVGAMLLAGEAKVRQIQQQVMTEINEPDGGSCRNKVGIYGAGVSDAFDGHEPTAQVTTNGHDNVWFYELLISGAGPDLDTYHPKLVGHQAEAMVARSALAATDFLACLRGNLTGSGGNNLVANSIAAGANHVCAVVPGDTVKCWGNNASGQLGDGTTTNRSKPVVAKNTIGAKSVAAGATHSCAVVSSGKVRCWGNNSFGQLGNNSTTSSLTAVDVKDISWSGIYLAGATKVAVGASHSCAIVTNGKVRCWGNNSSGQLGNGSMASSLTSVEVKNITGAVKISAGAAHTCVILSNATVWCWGSNATYQLGNGTQVNSSTPVQVLNTGAAIGIVSGDQHSCSLPAGGTIKCWGQVFYYFSGTGATAIAAGGDRTCATSGGPVTCASTADDSVTNLTNTMALAVGLGHVCALITGGKVMCWGKNDSGQLGNPNTVTNPTPVPVGD